MTAYKMGMVHERPLVIAGGKALEANEMLGPTNLDSGSVLEIRESEKKEK